MTSGYNDGYIRQIIIRVIFWCSAIVFVYSMIMLFMYEFLYFIHVIVLCESFVLLGANFLVWSGTGSESWALQKTHEPVFTCEFWSWSFQKYAKLELPFNSFTVQLIRQKAPVIAFIFNNNNKNLTKTGQKCQASSKTFFPPVPTQKPKTSWFYQQTTTTMTP